MADERRDTSSRPSEDKLLQRLRAVAAIVLLLLIVFLVVIDAVGRLYVTPDFHVSDVFLGTLVGAEMLLLGGEVASRLPIKINGNGK